MSTMRRFLHSLVLSVFTLGALIGPLPANAILKGVAAAPGLQNAANVSITGGTITGTSVPYTVLTNGIPFVSVSTGNIGNNGALTAITALDATYSDGCYMLFPAGAIAAGIPAASTWYWVVMSSATAGTIYNSTYTTGVPAVGVQTAFATTGPGAYTGSMATDQAISISIPAGAMGTQGQLRFQFITDTTNNANGKTITAKFGGTNFAGFSAGSSLTAYMAGMIANRGVANRQVGSSQGGGQGFGVAGAINSFRASVDTTAAQNFIVTLTKTTATDNLVLSAETVEILFR